MNPGATSSRKAAAAALDRLADEIETTSTLIRGQDRKAVKAWRSQTLAALRKAARQAKRGASVATIEATVLASQSSALAPVAAAEGQVLRSQCEQLRGFGL
jgi:hypothetical protein